jgi:predicted DCC family thiol-disulfide oxidoreductase YuxK
MPEPTGRESQGARRLVLGFDGGCAACSDLARRISERVGDKLEVRSLHHPQVEHWRGQALGENAPWAPTLFEVGGAKGVRVWTGPRMAVKLTRVLGPISTWRLMQALGEVGVPKAVGAGTPSYGAGTVGLSRGQFLRGMGGAALAFGVLSGTSSPAHAADVEVDYDGLVEVFSAIDEIPASVIARGDEATRRWLAHRLGDVDDPQRQGVFGCAAAIGTALVLNAIVVSKIIKIRAAIRAVGGVKNFARILVRAYWRARRWGYSRWGAIKYAAKRAAQVSGKDIVDALLSLFSLGSVVDACF